MTKEPEGPVGVFVAVFDSEDTADRAMKSIIEMHDQGMMLDIYDHAKVVRREDGKVEVSQAKGAGRTAGKGALAGALVGLFFPPAFIATVAIGAASGAVVGKVRDHPVDKGFLDSVGEQMVPGRTGILVITQPQHMETLKETVPSAIRTESHTFESLDGATVKEWIGTLAPEPAES